MIRRVESGVGRTALAVGGFLLATLVVGVVLGIANSNLFWGEDNQYGRVPVPGAATLQLPSGTVQVSAAAALPGRGNQTPDMPLPNDMNLAVVPVMRSAPPVITLHVGSSVNANDNAVDTQRPVWRVQIPQAGEYRVTARGDFTGYGVNAQLWFGYEPGFLHGPIIWLAAAGIVVLIALFLFALLPRIRGRSAATAMATSVGGSYAGH